MPSTIENQYVMLSGERGPDLGYPNVLTLSDLIQNPASIVIMTVKQFSAKFYILQLTLPCALKSC